MGSKAKAGRGTKLQRGDGATPTELFTTIAEVKDINGPQMTVSTVDVTSQDSTHEEFVAAIKASGEVAFQCNLIDSDAQMQALFVDYDNGTLRNFKLVANNHAVEGSKSTRTFAALVTNIGEQYPFNGAMVRDITLKISGAVARTYAPV